jgi:hypothetical protein
MTQTTKTPYPPRMLQSREERTLRVLFLIARRLHNVTNDSQDWQNVLRVEDLINDCAMDELNHD